MGAFDDRDADAQSVFISLREALEKLSADSNLCAVARVLRGERIHRTGGKRYRPGILIDGGYEEEPLGSLLEQTAETGTIPIAWDLRHEWGPDNVGWLRVALVENLNAAGLPAPASLLEPSPEYAPRRPPPVPAVEQAATASPQPPESTHKVEILAKLTTEPEPWIVRAREYANSIWLSRLANNKKPVKEEIAKEISGRLHRDDKMVTKGNKRIAADYVLRFALSPTANGGWSPPDPE